MDNWVILKKELSYYGFKLLENKKCSFIDENGNVKKCGVLSAIKKITKDIKEQKKLLFSLWQDVLKLLLEEKNDDIFYCDEKNKQLFLFSLKDLSKYLLCFEELDNSIFSNTISDSLNKDINSFTKSQIINLPDYKISIDWVTRLIQRLLYIRKILSYITKDKMEIIKLITKEARGISGPWSNLDLPMEERTYNFEEEELSGRSKDKKRQRRYTKSLRNYHSEGVGEGHYFREMRNEPFSWYERDWEDPYKHRSILVN